MSKKNRKPQAEGNLKTASGFPEKAPKSEKPKLSKRAKKVWKNLKKFGVCRIEFDSSPEGYDDYDDNVQLLTKLIDKGYGYVDSNSGTLVHAVHPSAGFWTFIMTDNLPTVKSKNA